MFKNGRVWLFALSLLNIGNAQTWTQVSPNAPLPVPRGFHGATAVYDPGTNRMIVFGGRDPSLNNLNDVGVNQRQRARRYWSVDQCNCQRSARVTPAKIRTCRRLRYFDQPHDCVWRMRGVLLAYPERCLGLVKRKWFGGTPTWTQLSPTNPSGGITERRVISQSRCQPRPSKTGGKIFGCMISAKI